LPEDAEAKGLLATMLYAKAREPARRTADGVYVPLSAQDTSRWDRACLAEAEATLAHAAELQQIGPFQLEAAIQSAHVHARLTHRDDPHAIAVLYQGLIQFAPTLGAKVAHAVALSRVEGAERGLELLEAIGPPDARDTYQPYWSARAHLLEQLGRSGDACGAYDRASGLSEDPDIRRFLLGKRRALEVLR
jgi:RNA polymerase sigma-70 factor (ECF subfamily)